MSDNSGCKIRSPGDPHSRVPDGSKAVDPINWPRDGRACRLRCSMKAVMLMCIVLSATHSSARFENLLQCREG